MSTAKLNYIEPGRGALFEARDIEKVYLAVARGLPAQTAWVCRLKLAPDPAQAGSPREKGCNLLRPDTVF